MDKRAPFTRERRTFLKAAWATIIGHTWFGLSRPDFVRAEEKLASQDRRSDIYFVSPGGNDKFPGSESKPWASLEKAVKALTSGDQLVVTHGIYRLTGPLVAEGLDRVTIKSHPGHRPKIIFQGGTEYSFLIGNNCQNVTIDGLTLVRATNISGYVLGVGGKHTSIKNCVVYFDRGYAPKQYDCIKVLADSVTIENCDIHGAPNQGIDVVGRRDIVIHDNRIYDCANAVIIKGGSKNIIIENNICYNHQHGAIGVGGTTAPKWHNHGNTGAEVEGAIVRRNIIYYGDAFGIGGGIFLMGAKACKVHNNTVYGAGIHVKTGGNPAHRDHYCSDNEISNNIIWATGDDGLLVVDEGNADGLVLRNNLYWKTAGPAGEFKVAGKWYSHKEYLLRFQFERNSLFADPRFTGTPPKSFSLMGDSPCVDAGAPIQGEKFDGKGLDIGALECF